MYQPSPIPYDQHRGFRHTFRRGKLSVGLFFPIEAFDGDMPTMLRSGNLGEIQRQSG